MATNLTDMQVRSIPFEVDGQADYPDRSVSGMFLRVGRRTKTFMLTVRTGRSRKRVTLGHYGDITLAQAREKARDILAEARQKKDEPVSITFQEALDLFTRLHVPQMRPLSRRECTRLLSTFHVLKQRRLGDIKTSDIAAIIDRIHKPAQKRNTFAWLRLFLGWCYQRGYIDTNPISRLACPKPSRPRERVLSDAEIVSIWKATFHDVTQANYGAFIRLLILTGQRRGQWESGLYEINGDTVTFPASSMKAGRAHTIPMTLMMRNTIGNHRFGGYSHGLQKRKLDRLSGVTGWTVHDLRRTTATKMAELGVMPHVIERILAHAMPQIQATYQRHSWLPEMTEAFRIWEERLIAIVAG